MLIKCISCNLVWDKDEGYIDPQNNSYHGHLSHGLCSKCLKEKCLELFRARQRKEGNFDCFGKANGYCDRLDCKYRSVCLGLSRFIEKRGLYMEKCKHCGREYFVGVNGFCSKACEELHNQKILSICQVCSSVFTTSYLEREQRVCSQKCADTLFNDMLSSRTPVSVSFLCPICYQEHFISDPDLVFFDSKSCLDEFLSLYGRATFISLLKRFREAFYSCERCKSSLHLRIVRVKGEFKLLCPECASFLKSDWNEEDTYVSTLDNYNLKGEPLFKKFPFDAGQDLRSLEEFMLNPGESHFFRTGISMQIPPDCVGLIRPRSGLAKKYSISILGGVVDSNYRGEIQVGLVNLGKQDCRVGVGDRIAQILVLRVHPKRSIKVESLSETDRSSKGFGHSGM